MFKRWIASIFLVSGCLMASGMAFGAAITVTVAEVPEGTAEATVEWSFENSDEDVTEIFFDITFATDHITPQTTEEEIFGLPQDVPDGCLDNVSGIANQACILIDDGNPSVIRISLDNSPNNLPDFVPGGTITFDIDPSAEIGDDTELELRIETMLPEDADVDLNEGAVNIVDVTAVLNVQPPELDFGTQQTGTTSGPQSATVSNDGTDGVDLEIESIDVSGDFDLAGGTCSVGTILADGEDCTIDVTFSPSADGPTSGNLTVGSDAGETTNDNVELLGEGIPTDAELVINPDSFDFGELDIDADPACEDFTLLNDNEGGNNSLDIGTVSIASPFSVSDNCDGEELTPGASCVVEVCFDPEDEGTFTETLTATSDVNEAGSDVSGEGTAEAIVSVDPDFGPVDLGVGEPGEVITADGLVTNSGSADADLSCTASGDTDVISTDPDPLAATIPANDEVPFSISCALPEDGDEGDSFSVTLSCDVDEEFVGEHEITCEISTFEPLPVPTMQTWALALFALLMLLAGGIGVRYFRTN